jgi:hypothetical protein
MHLAQAAILETLNVSRESSEPDVPTHFAIGEQCRAYLEAMRWPEGVRCVTSVATRSPKLSRKSGMIVRGKGKGEERKTIAVEVYRCLEPTCKQRFSATSGTIFNHSHLPLNKWFKALAIVVDAKER